MQHQQAIEIQASVELVAVLCCGCMLHCVVGPSTGITISMDCMSDVGAVCGRTRDTRCPGYAIDCYDTAVLIVTCALFNK